MIKLILKIGFICAISFTSVVQANLIQDTHYITFYDYNGEDIDVAWASNVSSERDYYSSTNINTLFAPEKLNDGWHFAEKYTESLDLLTFLRVMDGDELLAKFTNGNSYINAFSFWNSYITEVMLPDTENLKNNQINSEWSWTVASDDDNVTPPTTIPSISKSQWNLTPKEWGDAEKDDQYVRISNTDKYNFETFYFRIHDVQTGDTTSVPEPSTLMIFALGLIALVSKKKLFS